LTLKLFGGFANEGVVSGVPANAVDREAKGQVGFEGLEARPHCSSQIVIHFDSDRRGLFLRRRYDFAPEAIGMVDVSHELDARESLVSVSEERVAVVLIDYLEALWQGNETLDCASKLELHGWSEGRLTAYEFSGNNRANARLLSAATRG